MTSAFTPITNPTPCSPTSWIDGRNKCAVRRVTPDTGHFFFGYYDKSPWRTGGGALLACRADFMDRPPGPEDEIEIGLVDPKVPGTFRPLATTRAWNWQQGCMIQWLDASHIVFNDRRGDRFIAVILNVDSGERRELPRPIYSVSAACGLASSLNFARLHRLRPGYGYAGVEDATASQEAPTDDGLWVMDLATGDARLICSIDQARKRLPEAERRAERFHWMNHAQFAPSGRRLAVLHRWHSGEASPAWRTRLLTIDADGGEPYPLIDAGMCSHYDWRDDDHLLAFARAPRNGHHATGSSSSRIGPASPRPWRPTTCRKTVTAATRPTVAGSSTTLTPTSATTTAR